MTSVLGSVCVCACVRAYVCACVCVRVSVHTFIFVCVSRGVILDGFMICKDVCHIGSGGKQYPLCNRRKKASLALSFLTPSLVYVFSVFFCITFFHARKHKLM